MTEWVTDKPNFSVLFTMASEGVSVLFDEECRVRVLDPEKFKSTEQLQSECQAFVSSTSRCVRVCVYVCVCVGW